MSLELGLYLIDVIENLQGVGFGMMAILSFFCFIASSIFVSCVGADKSLDDEGRIVLGIAKKAKKILLFFFCVSCSLAMFLPTKNTLYMIAGTHYLKQNDIPEKVYKILQNKLEDLLAKEVEKKTR